jgi:hypothetical protein
MNNEPEERPSMTSINDAEEFLHTIIAEGEKIGILNYNSFLQYVPPQEIMLSLENKPLVRADLLDGSGLHDKIADDLSPSAAGEILVSAILHGVISPKDLILNMRINRCVRYLDRTKVWDYIANEWQWDFRKIRGDKERAELSATFFVYVLSTAIALGLLSGSDIIRGLGAGQIMHSLFFTARANLIIEILKSGELGKPFTASHLFNYLTLKRIVTCVPSATLWNKVVIPLIAHPNGFIVPVGTEQTSACQA